MTKADLMNLLGKNVTVKYKDGKTETGILKYVDDFSFKHHYKKVGYSYVENNDFCVNSCFKVSHILSCKEI